MNSWNVFLQINNYFKEKFGLEVNFNFEKVEDAVFSIPLHKISKQKNISCEKILEGVERAFGNLDFELENCFLKVRCFDFDLSFPLLGEGKKYVVEFSSPNIAKPFNVGHLRSTILGNALSNLLIHSGGEVIRINYLGDWGIQFGKLLYAYKHYGDEKELKERGLRYLFDLYVRVHKEEEERSEIKELAENEFILLEKGDKRNHQLWDMFRKASLDEFRKIYDLFEIEFDVVEGESDYVKDAFNLVNELLSKHVAFIDEKDKSVVVSTPYGNVVINKKGQRTLYSTRDLAAIKKRCEKYSPDEILYVVGSEQSQYFKQIFYVAKETSLCKSRLEHIDFGLFYLPEGRFSTRKGNVVFVDEFVDYIVHSVKDEFFKRGKKCDEEMALKLAINTIIFAILSQARRKNFLFEVKKFVSFNGETAIYLVYTYSRAKNVLNNYGGFSFNRDLARYQILSNKEGRNLLNFIHKFPLYFKKSFDNYDPHYLVVYAIEMSKRYNTLYQNVRFIGNEEFEHAGYLLSSLVVDSLQKVFDVIGFKKIEGI